MEKQMEQMMSVRKYFKCCVVPQCTSNSTRTPGKIFVSLPDTSNAKRKQKRMRWLRAMRRNERDLSEGSRAFVCEDHFNLEEDMSNYIQHKLVGGQIFIKDDVVPHIFDCQVDRVLSMQPPDKSSCSKRPTKSALEMDNICRTCLSQEQDMKSVFDTDGDSGEAQQLFEMLMACTSVQVQEDDGLPAQICLSCIENIARSFSFKKLCEDSDATLRDVLIKSRKTDAEIERKPLVSVGLCAQETLADNRDRLDIKLEVEEVSDTDYTDFERDESDLMINADDLEPETIVSAYNEDTKPDIKDDLMPDQIDSETNRFLGANENSLSPNPDYTVKQIYPCQHCSTCFTDENDLKMHSHTHRKLTKHKCEVCSQEFVSAKRLSNHMKAHDNVKPYTCTECGEGFKRPFELKKHARRHSNEKPFACKLCEKRFTLLGTLTRHQMQAHANESDPKFVCAQCGKGFASRIGLNKHIRSHTEIKTHACNLCGKKFRYPRWLTAHMKRHTGVKDHVCSYCGKRFALLSNFKTHNRLHTGEKPYTCNVCNKGFADQSGYTVHSRVHSGEKPYVCEVCGKGCVNSSQLKTHMRTHTGEKPYPCHLCTKSFTRGEHLRTHIHRHTGERIYKCVHCEKGFYESSKLKSHIRIHTGEKPYKCNVCNKSFSRLDNLNVHVKIH